MRTQLIFVMPDGKEIRMSEEYFNRHMPKSNIKYHSYGVSGEGAIHPDDIDKMFSRHSRKVKTIFDKAKRLYREYEDKNGLGLPEVIRDLVWIQNETEEEREQGIKELLSIIRTCKLGGAALAA